MLEPQKSFPCPTPFELSGRQRVLPEALSEKEMGVYSQ